jgi:hypothetical protein
MTFQLDTTGGVCAPIINGWAQWPGGPILNVGEPKRWADLDAFTQGYIEAAFASVMAPDAGPLYIDPNTGTRHCAHVFRFTDLHPETLATIIADCEAQVRSGWRGKIEDGRWFWVSRQNGNLDAFPPLTIPLGDDGKVRFQ